MASSRGMSARATASDQRSPCDKPAASWILSGGIRRGSSFLKPPRNLGVGTKTVMPRRSASARSGRCGESGLTLMAVALFHGSISRSRAAASSAPAKFGMRPCGGNGNRATPSAASLSQTYCRAALLSGKSQAISESGAARPGGRQGRDLTPEKSREITASPAPSGGGEAVRTGRNIMRIALAFEAGRDGFWWDLWLVVVMRKRPEYPVSGTNGSNPFSSRGESANFRFLCTTALGPRA